jgi:hypothetical protein
MNRLEHAARPRPPTLAIYRRENHGKKPAAIGFAGNSCPRKYRFPYPPEIQSATEAFFLNGGAYADSLRRYRHHHCWFVRA